MMQRLLFVLLLAGAWVVAAPVAAEETATEETAETVVATDETVTETVADTTETVTEETVTEETEPVVEPVPEPAPAPEPTGGKPFGHPLLNARGFAVASEEQYEPFALHLRPKAGKALMKVMGDRVKGHKKGKSATLPSTTATTGTTGTASATPPHVGIFRLGTTLYKLANVQVELYDRAEQVAVPVTTTTTPTPTVRVPRRIEAFTADLVEVKATDKVKGKRMPKPEPVEEPAEVAEGAVPEVLAEDLESTTDATTSTAGTISARIVIKEAGVHQTYGMPMIEGEAKVGETTYRLYGNVTLGPRHFPIKGKIERIREKLQNLRKERKGKKQADTVPEGF